MNKFLYWSAAAISPLFLSACNSSTQYPEILQATMAQALPSDQVATQSKSVDATAASDAATPRPESK